MAARGAARSLFRTTRVYSGAAGRPRQPRRSRIRHSSGSVQLWRPFLTPILAVATVATNSTICSLSKCLPRASTSGSSMPPGYPVSFSAKWMAACCSGFPPPTGRCNRSLSFDLEPIALGASRCSIAPATTLLVGSLFLPVEPVGLASALCLPAIPKVGLVLGGRLSLYRALGWTARFSDFILSARPEMSKVTGPSSLAQRANERCKNDAIGIVLYASQSRWVPSSVKLLGNNPIRPRVDRFVAPHSKKLRSNG